MIKIKIGETEYLAPQTPKDVTAGQFLEYLKAAESLSGNVRQYIAHCVNFFAGIPKEDLYKRVALKDLKRIYHAIKGALANTDENQAFDSFSIDGEWYYCPAKNMERSTLEDYAEACLCQENQDPLGLMAILCRKDGEVLDDIDLNERKEVMAKATLYDLQQVSFFLLRQLQRFATVSQICTTSQQIASLGGLSLS